MNHARSTKTLALASVALLALAGCGSSSSTTAASSSSTSSPAASGGTSATPDASGTTSATPAAGTSTAFGPRIEAGGHTDASLTKILVASGTVPSDGVASASQLATVHSQAPQQIAAFKAATFTPAPCGEHFVDYAGAVTVSGARADGRTVKPVELIALVAKSNDQEATDAVAAFEKLATECPTLSVKPAGGEAQKATFAKIAAPTVAGADQVVVGTMGSGGGSRRIQLARVGNVLVQVTSETSDAARAERTLAQVVKAVAAAPAK